jgi:hypothetical protein
MTIHLTLAVETLRGLAEKAAANGQTLEGYLNELAGVPSEGPNGAVNSSVLTDEEFERLLDELSAGQPLPILSVDFNRNDIYSDHD